MAGLYQKFVHLLKQQKHIDPNIFYALQRKFSKENFCDFLYKEKILSAYLDDCKQNNLKPRPDILKILQTKNVRSQSGIAVVSVLTKPYPCPGNCLFCPDQKGIPKSYLSGEPAVMRAEANNFHPYLQVQSRLTALKTTGHIVDKISIRIIGGSWSYYPKNYQSWFIRQLFKAANEFGSNLSKDNSLPLSLNCHPELDSGSKNLLCRFRIKSGITNQGELRNSGNSLDNLQHVNESAKCRIVELSIETRQDLITESELWQMRRFGITKVEIGAQSLDNAVLRLNRRGHSLEDTIRATKLLKIFGFKVSYQIMLNLLGTDYAKDLDTFKELFSNPNFKPDHLKIYPLAVLENSEMLQAVEKQKHQIYTEKELIGIISDIKKYIPSYCRIERVIRDIPSNLIALGGAKISNLRQEVEKELSRRGQRCQCIRCREIKMKSVVGKVSLQVSTYEASGAKEIFIESVDESGNLIGFCRLRLNEYCQNKFLNKLAIIREIHVYGPTANIGFSDKNTVQHHGYGKRMVREAEKLAFKNGYKKIAVIAGVGVRQYFRKLGYKLKLSYMIKELT